MTDEPTPDPLPEPDQPAPGEAPDAAVAGEVAPRKPFLMHFPRAPIPGTELTIRSPSVGQDDETLRDVTNEDLDDREFTVRLVQRQLDQDESIEEVGAWPDSQLLGAADAFLALVWKEPGLDDADDDEPIEGDDEAENPADAEATSEAEGDRSTAVAAGEVTEPEPLTFARFREEIRELNVRRARRMKRLFTGIMELTQANSKKIADLTRFDAGIFKAMDPLRGLDIAKLTSASLDPFKGIDLAKLTGTAKIGDSIAKMFADTQAMEKLVAPRFEVPPPRIAPIERLPYIAPIVRPEIGLLQDVGETLEKMHDDQTRTAQGQIDVMVEQTKLLKAQGVALTALVHDARGQKWSRRGMLAFTVIAAIAAVAAALYAGGFIHPVGAAGSPTPTSSGGPSRTPTSSLAPPSTVPPTPVPPTGATPAATNSASAP